MPRASSPKVERKPYSRSLESTTPEPQPETKPDVDATKTPKKASAKAKNGAGDGANAVHPNTTKKNKAWTNDEYAALFAHVGRLVSGGKQFEGAVEGRNRNQCYLTWKQVIEPYIYDAIAKKTKGNPRAKKGKDTKDESDA